METHGRPTAQVLKWRLLSTLPGSRGAYYRTRLRDLSRKSARREARRAFSALLPDMAGRTCIDVGANQGGITRELAAHAARVIAIEPDPISVAALRENTADLPNVEVIEAAVGTLEGRAMIYRSPKFRKATDSEGAATSLLSGHRRVSTDHKIEVRLMDFPGFLAGLEGEIGILKIDIEGAETELMETLIDHPSITRPSHIFIETHENHFPDHRPRLDALRAKAAGMTRPDINFDWV